MSSKIEWLQHPNFTGETWNVNSGCHKISEGCLNCYAETMHKRLTAMGQPKYKYSFNDFRIHPMEFDRPHSWRKPRMVFINSMSDLFHASMPFIYLDGVFETIVKCWANYTDTGKGDHIFLILTKRAERMCRYVNRWLERNEDIEAYQAIMNSVWFGITAENQKCYDERALWLEQIETPNKFISFEPLLEPIHFDEWPLDKHGCGWVIIGCESGKVYERREFRNGWAMHIIDNADAQHIPVFVKQIPVLNTKTMHHVVSKQPNADWASCIARREWPDAFNGRGTAANTKG